MGALYLCDALEKSGIECRFVRCDTAPEELEKLIRSFRPAAIAMSVITSFDIPLFVNLSRHVKKVFTGMPVIWGGVHPSLNPEQCAAEDFIDHVITGQGEEALPEMALSIAKGGKPDRIVHGKRTRDLDAFSPRWEKLDLSKFVFLEQHSVHSQGKIDDDKKAHIARKHVFYYLLTSRGCVYRCTFCSEPLAGVNNTGDGKPNWHAHSYEWVENEVRRIKELVSSRGLSIDGIGIWDDMFWVDRKRAYRILDLLKRENLGYLIEARADHLIKDDAALLRKLGDTGCMQVFVGAESADQKTLDYLRKGTRVNDYRKIIKLGEKFKVAVRLSLIVGFPGETDESVNRTIDFSEQVTSESRYASISGPKIFTPYPGTVEYERAVKRGFVVPQNTLQWGRIHRKAENCLELYPWLKENLEEDTIRRIEKVLSSTRELRGAKDQAKICETKNAQ